jgi:hypothetical protein
MQLIKNIIYSLSAICIFASCGEKFFDTTLELPTPEHTPVMAVSAFINSTDSDSLKFKITRTYGLFEERPTDSRDNLSGATVKLFEDGNLLYDFEEENTEFDAGYISPTLSEAFGGEGKTYKLEVSHPDYGTATATQVMPNAVPLTNVEYRQLESNEIFEGGSGEFRLVFDDPADEENYYEVAASQKYWIPARDSSGMIIPDSLIKITQEIYLGSDGPPDPNVTEGFNDVAMLISDKNFDGQTFTLSAEFYEYSEFEGGEVDPPVYTIYWRSVSKDYFNYSKSLLDNERAQNNPFAEPVSLYTNIDGGVGAFCLRSELVYEVE